ncbi:M56 family metallopeptidase [Streptomyces sp. NPDC048405]|uniref:M56 family metallopeptidase n=1 Tax=Streptomyces TaxID=1883 RepID=UPI000D59716F|nr:MULTISPECIES: M56 family metallopeptidase [Streptomyces]MBU6532394.1 M56 family metallopeptidase [Streptomyces sp. A108]
MTVALLLLGYSAVLGGLGPLWLKRASWLDRAPRLGIWAWHALTATVIISVTLAGLAVAVPTVPVSGNLAAMLQECVMALRAQYAAPGGAAVAASGTVLAFALVARIGWCLAAALVRARRQRSEHAAVLDLAGRHRPDLGVTVLDHDRPAAYCLPGHGHRVVLTTAALTTLEPRALDAVIAHERAHIRQRHHLVLAYAEALERAFPRVPLFRTAASETRRLVELAADDEATARSDALTLASALVEMAGAGVPAASLAASGGHAAGRVRRLLAPQRPLKRAIAWGGALVAGAVLVLPLVVAVEPAVAASGMNACPLPTAPPVAAPQPAY